MIVKCSLILKSEIYNLKWRELRIAECGLRNEEHCNPQWKRSAMTMNRDEMQERTKSFAIAIIQLVEGLAKSRTGDVVGRQLLRCGTSVGASYRAACRARLQADFISKMGIVEEEADESIYWIEILVKAALVKKEDVVALLDEANQLVAITVSSIRTAKKNSRVPQSAFRNLKS